ncbi:MAG: DMT family transporter [Hyphomonadaceae bacterium]|nr:DMT family transporter [Clostridia bacterium]
MTEKKIKLLATIALIFTVIMWGVSFISIKVALKEIQPMTLALLRFFIATPILLFFAHQNHRTERFHVKDIGSFMLSGFFGITIYFYLENTGVALTTVTNASLILALTPIISIPLEMIFWRARIGWVQAVAMCLSVLGAYFVVASNQHLASGGQVFRGNLLMLGACFSWVIYNFLSKPLLTHYTGLFVSAYQNLFGTIFTIPFVFFETSSIPTISLVAWGNVLFLALICSALCYFLYVYALDHLGLNISIMYLNLVPAVGAISSVIFLHESITLMQCIGGLIILLGVFIVSMMPQRIIAV